MWHKQGISKKRDITKGLVKKRDVTIGLVKNVT